MLPGGNRLMNNVSVDQDAGEAKGHGHDRQM
jgi:hypothetical protein